FVTKDKITLSSRIVISVTFGALSLEADFAVLNSMPTAFENQYNIIGRAAPRTGKQKLHRACSAIVAATLWSAIHGHDVTTTCAGDKEHAILIVPLYCCLHGFLRVTVKNSKHPF